MDTTYRTQDAKALEQWARTIPSVQLNLVFSKQDPSPSVWQDWEKGRKKVTGYDKRPANLRVFQHLVYGHCALPESFLLTYLYS
jgi:hypothetical protein